MLKVELKGNHDMRGILQAFVLLVGLHGSLLAHGASAATVQGGERESYVREVMRLHASSDETEALLLQLNYLLQEHVLLSGYQVGLSQPRDYVYSVSIAGSGVLDIREQQRDTRHGDVRVSSQQLPVFGIAPFFNYDCGLNRFECRISHADSQTRLLRVVREPEAARELVRVLSYLVRSMQRNSQAIILE